MTKGRRLERLLLVLVLLGTAAAAMAGEIAFVRTETGAAPVGARKRAVEKTLIFAERQIYWPGANVLHEWQDRHLFHDATLRAPADGMNGMQRGFFRDVEVLKDCGLDGFGAIAYHNVNIGHLSLLETHPKVGYVQMPIICPTDGGINLNEGVSEAIGISAAYRNEKNLILAHAKSPYAAKVNGKLLIWGYGGSEETNLAWAKMMRADKDLPPFVFVGPMPFIEIYKAYGFCQETGRLESGRPQRIPEATLKAYREKVDEYAKAMGGFQLWCVNRRRDWNGEYPVITEATPIYRDYLKPICEEVVSRPENKDVLVGAYLRQGYVNKYQGTTDGEYGTETLRAYLDEMMALNPDIFMCFEWNEENENTFFQPTVAHGKTWTRILNFYRAHLDRVTPQTMKGDDTSVPNLVVSARQSVKLGEKYHLELLYLPDGAKEPEVTVQVTLRDEKGDVLTVLPEERIPTDALKAIGYRIASEQFAGHAAVTPELSVRYGGSSRTYGPFDATRLTPTVNNDFLYTHQPLREMLVPEAVRFDVAKTDKPGAYAVDAAFKAGTPLRSLEVLEGLEEIAAVDDSGWNDNEAYALFRGEFSALMPEQLGEGADRWVKGTCSFEGAKGEIRSGEYMWEMLGVQPREKGATTDKITVGFGERLARFFVRVPREELAGAKLVLDVPRLGRLAADLAEIESLGKYSWELGKTVRYTLYRLDDLADIPAPLRRNEATLKRTVRTSSRNPLFQLRAVAMDGRIYRSAVRMPEGMDGERTEIRVFSETERKPVAVFVPKRTLPTLDYAFDPAFGQSVTCGWEDRFDAQLGGGSTPGLPMALAGVYGKLPKRFDGPAGAQWVKGTDGWELDFANGSYLNLPQEVVPMAAEFSLAFEILPRMAEDQVLWRSSNTGSPDDGLQVLLKGGTLHVSYYGIHYYKPPDFDTKAKIAYGQWNTVRIVRFYDKIVCEVNGQRASFPWDRRARHFTGMIFGANVKPNETARAGIQPFSGRLRRLRVEHAVPDGKTDGLGREKRAAPRVTAGWENANPARKDYPATKVLWRADMTTDVGYRLRKIGGAEGTFALRNGEIEILKTNDTGLLVLETPPAALPAGSRLRMSAEVHAESCDIEHSHACLRVRDENGAYPNFHKLTPANSGDSIVTSGPELARGLSESAPGTYALKYGQWIVRDGETVFAIVVSGRPSVTRWRDFLAEDYDAAHERWKAVCAERTARDHAAERMDEEAFDRFLAADGTDHVAELRTADGVTSLFVDDRHSPAVAYKGKHSFASDALKETFCGGRLAKAGVPLMVRTLNLGTGVDPRRYWSKRGFDAKGAARDVKDAMRLAPEALFMIGLSCNAYPEFTNVEHPDQVWITPKGEKLMGCAGTTDDSDDMGIKDNRRWPWVSMASPVWREAIKGCIRELVAELKAQGLSRRIVGLHLSGFADGQFYPPTADHSPMARRRYETWCAEGEHVSTNYWFYCKNLGMDAQNEFAREFKRALGKPAVAVRWCLCEFIGSQDITEFCRSDALDVIVAQPAYTRRHPGFAQGPNMPFSSFARDGKMFWMEFDFRTYAALDTWAVSSVAAKGCGEAVDFPMWQSLFRKYAGLQLATRSGWWFYDMAGGWWDRKELAEDIASVVEVSRELSAAKPTPWRPSVAVVYDEKGLVGWDGGVRPQNEFSHLLFPYQQRRFAASGVPYEFFMAADAMKDPSLLKDARMIVFANFRKLDAERIAFVKSLSGGGRTLLFLAETGVLGGSEEGTTFRTEYDFANRPHEVVSKTTGYDMLALNEAIELRELEKGLWPVPPAMGPRGTVVPGPGVRVLSTFAEDSKPACVIRDGKDCRRVYCCEPSGVSPQAFLAFAQEAGAYAPVGETGVQVDMNGEFVSVHALRNGRWTFKLPRSCKVVNLKSGLLERVQAGTFELELTAGETCWFRLADM